MKLLILGDIMGASGRDCVKKKITENNYRKKN